MTENIEDNDCNDSDDPFLKQAKAIFKKLDKNNDDKLDYSEFIEACLFLGKKDIQDIRNGYKNADLDKDGNIIFKEFIKYLQKA